MSDSSVDQSRLSKLCIQLMA